MTLAEKHDVRRAFVTGGSGFIGSALIKYLRSQNIEVAALARSNDATKKVSDLGAVVINGDLSDETALSRGAEGCDVIFHTAANPQDRDRTQAMEDNVAGSLRVVRAARATGVKRVIYLSGIGVLFGSGEIHNVDEAHPRGKKSGALIASRIAAEEELLAASDAITQITIVRLPYVWGPGNTLIAPLKASVEAGRFRWIGSGKHKISILHIENGVRGLMAAAERGKGGEIYWLSDGGPVELRDFFERQLAAYGAIPPAAQIRFGTALVIAKAASLLRQAFGERFAIPLTPATVKFLGQEITVNDSKARRELGYTSVTYWPHGPM